MRFGHVGLCATGWLGGTSGGGERLMPVHRARRVARISCTCSSALCTCRPANTGSSRRESSLPRQNIIRLISGQVWQPPCGGSYKQPAAGVSEPFEALCLLDKLDGGNPQASLKPFQIGRRCVVTRLRFNKEKRLVSLGQKEIDFTSLLGPDKMQSEAAVS